MEWKVFLVVPALAALPASAGLYNQPYGLVESGRRSDVRKELPVVIGSVDGVSTRNPRYSDPIAPGRHRIQVNFSTSSMPTARAFRFLDLDIKPCTRYRVVAAYQNLVHPASWEPRIYVEPIGECATRFQARMYGDRRA